MYQSAQQKLREYLSSRGLKLTRERKEILKAIMETHSHFEVDDIFIKLRRKKLKISQTSIYRTLPLLVESGIVLKNTCDRMTARYEHVLGHDHHDHMVCVKCGKIIEFQEDNIEELQVKVSKKHKFKILGHRLVIRGLCEKCL